MDDEDLKIIEKMIKDSEDHLREMMQGFSRQLMLDFKQLKENHLDIKGDLNPIQESQKESTKETEASLKSNLQSRTKDMEDRLARLIKDLPSKLEADVNGIVQARLKEVDAHVLDAIRNMARVFADAKGDIQKIITASEERMHSTLNEMNLKFDRRLGDLKVELNRNFMESVGRIRGGGG